jgi:hypothetical protein
MSDLQNAWCVSLMPETRCIVLNQVFVVFFKSLRIEKVPKGRALQNEYSNCKEHPQYSLGAGGVV